MRYENFPLLGGINIATPVIALKPGFAFVAINYEMAPVAGYRRVKGYERFDGRQSPTEFEYGEARQAQRALILQVPGSGPVRGVFVLKGSTYAFRNSADGTSKKLYRATPGGWVLVTTPTLLPGGRLEVALNNFYGNANGLCAYGVDGVNKAFQFDGTTYVEITTGAEPAVPSYVTEFKSHLFLAYPGGSLQNSATGDPLNYVPTNGAGEIAVGDEIYGIIDLKGGALGIFCRDRISILSGTSIDDFALQIFSEAGVKPYSVQALFTEAVYLDKQIQRMSSSDTFGDFEAGLISEPVRPLIARYLTHTQLSLVSKERNQYILFDTDGNALITTFNGGRLSGFTTMALKHKPFVGHVGEGADGAEIIFLGGQNGFVYQLNKGSSFDGEPIPSFLLLAPNHQRSFDRRKRYRKVVIETDSVDEATLTLLAEYDYGQEPRAVATQFLTLFQGGLYDFSNYNEVRWSGDLKGYANAYIDGHGRNIAIFIYHESDLQESFTLESMTIGFDFRGAVR